MNSDIRSVFREVADLTADQREQYFSTHGVAAEVREEIQSLLCFDGPGGGDSVCSVVSGAATDWATSGTSATGGFCGPYRLIRLLAQGGMGAVYLGQRTDGEVDLQVAIKFVNATIAGYKDFEARFLKERQILASLTHPGIARLLDAGRTVDRGHPYLVMEYVDGVPIDVYCENLDLRAKLSLYLDVCDAVSYSHRNLIIHRDLKPSNILVDKEGMPKLLDFGIAKILDEAVANPGVTRERLLTPEYASPEQMAGQANTTATDIYSLGTVLRRMIMREVSTSGNRCPQDLSFIINKAMREDPAGRYPSVDAMAEDIRAMLESRPVKARSGDMWYRARRFFRRHWLPSTALAAAVLSLSGSLYVSNRDRLAAQQRFSQLRQMANTMLNFDASLRPLPGSTKAREQLVIASLQYLDGLRREANTGNDADLALEVANGYKLMAQVQGVPRTANLGKTANADVSLGKAGEITNHVLSQHPARLDALLLGAEIAANRAAIADWQDSAESVTRHSASCAALIDRLLRTGKASSEQKVTASRLLSFTGMSNYNLQLLPGAARYVNASIALAREAGPQSPILVQGLSSLSSVLRRGGDLEAALRAINEARAVQANATYPDERTRINVAYAVLSRQGSLLGEDEAISFGRPEEALQPLVAARNLAEEEVAKDPNDTSALDRVAKMERLLGDILRHTDSAKALSAYELCVARLRAVDNVTARRDEARCLAKAAAPLRKLGRADQAKRRLDQAFAILQKTKDYPPPRNDLADALDDVMRELGQHELETGHPGRAREVYERLLQWMEERKIAPTTLALANSLSRLYVSMEKVYAALGLHDEFTKLDARRTQIWREWDKKLPGNPFVTRQLQMKIVG